MDSKPMSGSVIESKAKINIVHGVRGEIYSTGWRKPGEQFGTRERKHGAETLIPMAPKESQMREGKKTQLNAREERERNHREVLRYIQSRKR